ncbi:Endonuclease/exonuclease/phosphatase [Trinorchestia longiramus]|nr:Endonuclease/exonuclease/phosphatase [Trinorchestia longiramus]
MSELQAIVSTLSHDIIAINETWLDTNGRHLPAEVSIKGYILHNVDKPSHSNRGGGSLIYVKEKLQPQIKTKRATEKSEILHLNIQPHPGQTIKIVLMYRNPTCTAIEDDEFYDCLDIILSTPHETLIMGDFNLPHLNWTTRQSQAPGSKLIDLMNTNSLQQHINKPTRGNNIFGLVMRTTDSINSLEVTEKIGDHQMIDFSLEVQDPNTRTQHKQVLDYKRANFELMKEELSSYNYEVLMNNKNAEECYMILKDKIATATDHQIPRKRIRPTNNPPWFSQEIKRLINARQHSPIASFDINTSIATNKFPDPWKRSIIKPLHKAGVMNTASNYRPISLLPVLSVLLEKVISNQLSTHLDKSNLLHPNQCAYRKHTSTQDALLNIIEKIYSDIDTKNVTLLLLLDLSKAFDSVEHKQLLQKISNLGIATQGFQSYLANRSHAVQLENTISSPVENNSGVPQGSILGPLLLSIFINDFPSMPSNTRISMYADDVQIAMTSAPTKVSQTKSNAEILFNT